MEKIKGFNRNLIGGKRPHKGIQTIGHCKTLAERLELETKRLNDYLNRIKSK